MRVLSLFIMMTLSVYYLNCNENGSEEKRSGINEILFPDGGFIHPASDKVILANGTYRDQYKFDPFQIQEALITGDSIIFKVTYGGGCREHDFSLIAYSYFLESYPVQANLVLAHNSHKDGCEALITKTNLIFDLSPLKEKYGTLSSMKSDKIILKVFNDKESKTPLRLIYQLN